MLIVRQMKLTDAVQASTLEKETFTQPWTLQDFERAAADENSVYVVAEENGVIIGMCGVRNIVGEGEITNVAVKADRRREGIAGKLLDEILRLGTLKGIRAFTLEVRESNLAAIALYKKYLFTTEGIRKNFYEKPIENALIMWKR